jgi:hypothetical protein
MEEVECAVLMNEDKKRNVPARQIVWTNIKPASKRVGPEGIMTKGGNHHLSFIGRSKPSEKFVIDFIFPVNSNCTHLLFLIKLVLFSSS